MKSVNKIFVWAFIILSLLPIFEFFLFQWKNDNRVGLNTTASISVLNYPQGSNIGYVVYYLPTEINSMSDYFISEYSYGIVQDQTVNLQGFAKIIFQFIALITRNMSAINSSGTFLVNLLALSLLITRTVYIACLLVLSYVIILPVVVVSDFFKRRFKL